MTLDFRRRAGLTAAIVFAAATFAQAQPAQPTTGNGVLVNAAPMFLTPDPNRTPLATLPFGTNVRVVEKVGDWYRVVYRDQYLGDRTGYVRIENIRIEPRPAAVPPAPAAPGQAAPGQPAP